MPNRTIYVADADIPLFEKAQQLFGGNLSATITEALRRFVASQENRQPDFEEITVEVGKVAFSRKRFQGRLLAKGRTTEQKDTRTVSYKVYQTPKGNIVVYVRNTPNWNYWSGGKRWSETDWSNNDWSSWANNDKEYRLEVYSTLEELEYNVPREIYEAVGQVLNNENADGVEVLDI